MSDPSYVAMSLDDGSWFQIRDLPWEVLKRLERDFSTPVAIVVDMPWVNGGLLEAVAVAVAIQKDQEPIGLFTGRDFGALVDRFGNVDEDGNPIVAEKELGEFSWSADG